MLISDWSSDVCSADLRFGRRGDGRGQVRGAGEGGGDDGEVAGRPGGGDCEAVEGLSFCAGLHGRPPLGGLFCFGRKAGPRSEEHTSELQSLMRISYAVFCLKKKNKRT